MKFGKSGRSVVDVELSATVEEVAGTCILDIHVTDASVASWTIGLCLLKERLVEALSVRSEGGSFRLTVETDLARARCKIQYRGRSFAGDIAIDDLELDRWVHFFLCYSRDGYAPVDHLDIDLDFRSEPTLDGMLVLRVPYPPSVKYRHAAS